MDRYLIVSTDGHAGLLPEEYRPYVDPAYRDAFDATVAEEIAANPPLTVRGTKEVMRFSEGKDPREGLAYVAAWNSAFLASVSGSDLIKRSW